MIGTPPRKETRNKRNLASVLEMDGFKGNLVHHLEFAPGFWWLPNLVEEDEFLRVPREGPMPLQWAIVFVVSTITDPLALYLLLALPLCYFPYDAHNVHVWYW